MNNGTSQKPDFWGYFCTFVMDYACRGRRRDTVHTPTKGPLHIVHLAGKTGWMVYNSLYTVGGNSIPAPCFCGPDAARRFSFSCPFACWIALWFEFCGFAGKQEMPLRLPYARRNGFVQNGCLHVDRSENTSAAVPLAVGSLDFARDDHTGTVMSRERSDSRHPLVEARHLCFILMRKSVMARQESAPSKGEMRRPMHRPQSPRQESASSKGEMRRLWWRGDSL